MTTLRAGSATDVGQVRSNNQDAALSDPAWSVFAVAVFDLNTATGGNRAGRGVCRA